jgi:allophanate hydrolase
MTITDLRQSYGTGRTTPRALLADLLQRLRTDADQAIFIHLLTDSEIEPYLAALDGRDPSSLPLFGVPFAIKDNIDLARIPTTAACAEFAYTPERSATVVQRSKRGRSPWERRIWISLPPASWACAHPTACR